MQVKEIRFGNALLKVHRPILAEEEREKRERDISKSLLRFGKAMKGDNQNEKTKSKKKVDEAV